MMHDHMHVKEHAYSVQKTGGHLGLVLLCMYALPLQFPQPDLILPAHPPLLPRQQRPASPCVSLSH